MRATLHRSCNHDHRHGLLRWRHRGPGDRGRAGYCARCGSYTTCDSECRLDEARQSSVLTRARTRPF